MKAGLWLCVVVASGLLDPSATAQPGGKSLPYVEFDLGPLPDQHGKVSLTYIVRTVDKDITFRFTHTVQPAAPGGQPLPP